MAEIFTSERIHPRVIKINDRDVYMFLIEGDEKAALIDTGYGVGRLKEYVESLTDKPLIVINTHSHGDHCLGSGWFEKVYMNKADWQAYYEVKDPQLRYERNQERGAYPGVPLEDYAPAYDKPFEDAPDGMRWALGGLTLEAILVPGHTMGSIMILLREERIIIYGDAVGRRMGLLSPNHPASTYLKGLHHLKEYDGTYDVIWRSHNGLTVPLDILDNIIECCEDMLAGTDAAQPTQKHGWPCFSAREIDENQVRIDGKQGNIFYIKENLY